MAGFLNELKRGGEERRSREIEMKKAVSTMRSL